jgi:lysophospholipid acyltransferase (LPLAT)-like uncharacterized protein
MAALPEKILVIVGPWLAAKVIRLLSWCLKPDFIGEEQVQAIWDADNHVIISLWHDQLLLMVRGYHGSAACALISGSQDGELIARTLGYFDVDAVRGSSSRGGRAAFKALVDLSAKAVDLVFTPDGPRGPRHQVKEGVVQLARISKRPVVPMAFACSRGHRFRSWDRFLLPYPFGKAVYSFGTPLYYTDADTPETFLGRVQDAMDVNTRNAVEYLEKNGLSAV